MPTEWTDAEFELLSAYIDEQLDDSERTALEARLAEDAELRQELAAMRQTVALLHSLPTIQAPRSFALTPEMVGQAAVPALTVLPTTEQKIRPLPPRRQWWIPAASAAGVVLLAGVVFLTQNAGAPANRPSVAMNSTLVASTATLPPPQGSQLNVVIHDIKPLATSAFDSTMVATLEDQAVFELAEQASSTPMSTEGFFEEQASDNAQTTDGEAVPDPVLPPQPATTMMPVQSESESVTGSTTVLGMPEPVEASPEQNVQQPAPGAPADIEGEVVLIPNSSAVMPTTESLDQSQATGSGGGPPRQGGEYATTGIVGINTDPNAPGFTVATMSPVQVTEVALYTMQGENIMQADAAAEADSIKTKSAPALRMWLESLIDWFEALFSKP